MTLCTFYPSHFGHCYYLFLFGQVLKLLGQLFVQAFVVWVVFHSRNFCFAVAIYTPAHGEWLVLFYSCHCRHIAVASGTLLFAHFHVLLVTKENKVGQGMYFGPNDWFLWFGVGAFVGIPTCCFVYFCNFGGAGGWAFRNSFVAIHTHIHGRNACCFTFFYARVAVLAIDSVVTSVDFVREGNGLRWMISFINTDAKQTIPTGIL